MKSFVVITLASAFTSAVSAFGTPNTNIHPYLNYRSDWQVETRHPVIVVETVTQTKYDWGHKKGKSYHKYKYHDKDEDEDEDEDDEEEEDVFENPEWARFKSENVYGPKATNANVHAAQVTSMFHSITSDTGSRATSIASHASSDAVAAASSIVASSNGEQLRVESTFLAMAGFAFYWLL